MKKQIVTSSPGVFSGPQAARCFSKQFQNSSRGISIPWKVFTNKQTRQQDDGSIIHQVVKNVTCSPVVMTKDIQQDTLLRETASSVAKT